jgi:DNA-binding GntR family transcriptional regulator
VRGQLLLREALECQSARVYCGEKIKAARQRIRPLAEAVDKTAAAGKPFYLEEFEFHQALVGLTECDALIRCFQRVVNLSLFHEVSVITPMRPVTFEKHVEVLDDLCKASADQADVRMRKHIRAGKKGLLE